MSLPPPFQSLLVPGCEVRQVTDGIWSVLPESRGSARYDHRAKAYDWVVGHAIYNRLAWGATTKGYRDFASRAGNSGTGPFLDAGCGSAVFTANIYARLTRSVVLVDRSLSMLRAARDRLRRAGDGALPAHVALLQADVLDLPFHPHCFSSVLSMGMLHLFDDQRAPALVRGLAGLAMPGGNLFMTSLVAEQAIGRCYLALLHRAGEVAAPRSAKQLCSLLRSLLGDQLDFEREGSMAYVVANG